MNRQDSAPPKNHDTSASGFSLVEIMIMALVILLIGHWLGYAITLISFAVSVGLATVIHYAGRKLTAFVLRNS